MRKPMLLDNATLDAGAGFWPRQDNRLGKLTGDAVALRYVRR
jgi:hypothetical protein